MGEPQVAAGDADHSARVRGQMYTLFMGNLHSVLKPSTYFEIGTLTGGTLKYAQCPSIAVDPKFRITSEDVIGSKPCCMFFQEPSDRFFRTRNPSALFGREIDMAFLDGMHMFEFLLRDFINAERHCRKNSVVILHDCLPPGFYMTARKSTVDSPEESRFKGWWTGDVWKVIPVLEKYRPELSITVVDCIPTGLVLITNLDPESRVLEQSYGDILAEYSKPLIDRAEYDQFWANVKIVPSSELVRLDQIAARYWL